MSDALRQAIRDGDSMRAARAKRALGRVGMAALSTMTEDEIKADPAHAMLVAQGAMRAVVRAAQSREEPLE